ncbi:MAG TPA: ABC transporter ATP-binding protein [Candidatus Limnocylindrales bacterium]|nr:ABC transporter ATP-binding protein [Candidatus Limnocylindrales bacterium]
MTAGGAPAPAQPASGGSDDGRAIRAEGIRKAYGRRTILEDVSFSVRRGELFALLGPNGAGKTTTVEILEGYRRADGGTVRVLGMDPSRDGRALRPRIGLMLQEGGIDNRSTPREVLRLYAGFFRDPEDPDALLEAVDLGRAASTRYRRLSGGEKQRLGLALALLGRPELLVLDEPTAGMDPAAKQATRERIAGLRAAGTTILLTTHELGDVERLADHVAVLDRGRIVALGTPAELTGAGAPRIRFRLASVLTPADAVSLVASVAPGNGATLVPAGAGAHYELTGLGTAPDPRTVAALAAWCAERGLLITELRLGAASLEERYLELVGADVAAEADVTQEASAIEEASATLGAAS